MNIKCLIYILVTRERERERERERDQGQETRNARCQEHPDVGQDHRLSWWRKCAVFCSHEHTHTHTCAQDHQNMSKVLSVVAVIGGSPRDVSSARREIGYPYTVCAHGSNLTITSAQKANKTKQKDSHCPSLPEVGFSGLRPSLPSSEDTSNSNTRWRPAMTWSEPLLSIWNPRMVNFYAPDTQKVRFFLSELFIAYLHRLFLLSFPIESMNKVDSLKMLIALILSLNCIDRCICLFTLVR